MVSVGIDVGKKGGYGVIYDDDTYETYPWDNAKFIEKMWDIAQTVSANERIIVCVEKVGAMPHQGVTSCFNFGKAAGFIEGVLEALGIPYQLITPQRWKREFLLNSEKTKSIEVCQRLFPKASLLPTERCKVPSDGMAEALLMAEYARRNL